MPPAQNAVVKNGNGANDNVQQRPNIPERRRIPVRREFLDIHGKAQAAVAVDENAEDQLNIPEEEKDQARADAAQ